MLRELAGGGDPVETHISLVFRGTDSVWKLKKAVKLPFLDFTRPADRRHFAQRELALNAAAAAGMYRDVVPVTRQPDGTLTLGGDPDQALDWVVRMARVPADDFLDVMAAAHRLDGGLLDAMADSVAAYHQALPPVPDILPPMRDIAGGNVRSATEAALPASKIAAWEAGMLAGLSRLDPWLRQRARDGFVRRAHGDLHLGNLCLWQGRPVPFDALEFDEAMATIDLAYDFAFLLMDLEQRLGRSAANRVLNRYVARTGDAALVTGLPVFLSMRAMVRAHVEARTGHAAPAARYLDAALAYLRPPPPLVAAVGGLPGTGKSTLARVLAPDIGAAPGALILRSDEIRKRRFGVAPEERLPESAYAESVSEAVFADLAATARTAAEAGHAVVADATFMDPRHRALIASAAAAAGVPFVGLWLQAPLPELEARVAARTGDASDATVDVLRSAAQRDPGPGDWTAIDASRADRARDLAKAVLAPHIVP